MEALHATWEHPPKANGMRVTCSKNLTQKYSFLEDNCVIHTVLSLCLSLFLFICIALERLERLERFERLARTRSSTLRISGTINFLEVTQESHSTLLLQNLGLCKMFTVSVGLRRAACTQLSMCICSTHRPWSVVRIMDGVLNGCHPESLENRWRITEEIAPVNGEHPLDASNTVLVILYWQYIAVHRS